MRGAGVPKSSFEFPSRGLVADKTTLEGTWCAKESAFGEDDGDALLTQESDFECSLFG